MAQSVNPHERFFKEAFSREDVAASILRHHLPADLSGLIQPDSL
ncbi:Rpn family recombination-promoting nuclease/putative transposase [Methylolobus aquaticus]